MGTDPAGFWVEFRPQRTISLLVAAHAAGLGHVGAVGLAVLVVGILLTGGTTQTLVHLVLVVHRRRVAAAQRWVLACHGGAPLLRIRIPRDDGAAVQVLEHLGGVEDREWRRHQRWVETRLMLLATGKTPSAGDSAKNETHSRIWGSRASICRKTNRNKEANEKTGLLKTWWCLSQTSLLVAGSPRRCPDVCLLSCGSCCAGRVCPGNRRHLRPVRLRLSSCCCGTGHVPVRKKETQ